MTESYYKLLLNLYFPHSLTNMSQCFPPYSLAHVPRSSVSIPHETPEAEHIFERSHLENQATTLGEHLLFGLFLG